MAAAKIWRGPARIEMSDGKPRAVEWDRLEESFRGSDCSPLGALELACGGALARLRSKDSPQLNTLTVNFRPIELHINTC